MSETRDVAVPDIGDFKDVEVIDVLVKAGDSVDVEDGLITLETDKAAMDVPSPFAGKVEEVLVSTGDKVSEGSVIAKISTEQAADAPAAAESESEQASEPGSSAAATDTAPDESAAAEPAAQGDTPVKPAAAAQGGASYSGNVDIETKLLVLGAGPGGYTAAFRAADLGIETTLVERYESLGGVCLNVGCIPSKAMLHVAKVIDDAGEMAEHGVRFGEPDIDTEGLRKWKNKVVGQLTQGLAGLAKKRKVNVVTGAGEFLSPNHLKVSGDRGEKVIGFEQCIIAAGSQSAWLPFLPDDDRIMTSTGALELDGLPERMLVIGGGIIGLEMATVYQALGVKVSVVELTPGLMPGCDPDLVKPLQKRIESSYEQVMLGVGVSGVESTDEGLRVTFEGDKAPDPQMYGRILVAVGRKPNGLNIGADKAGVAVDERGFIAVDRQMRTNQPNIFAIGDIVGNPMLAHKASHEGKVAAEVAAGQKRFFDARVIPSVAYTDPEIAWVGPTEAELKKAGKKYGKGVFPWAASGRSLSLGRSEGFTKLLFDEETERVIGAGIVGPQAGDLISEVALAIEMGCDAADIGLTVHPHPTLSETVAFAAEAFEGTLTDLYIPKKNRG